VHIGLESICKLMPKIDLHILLESSKELPKTWLAKKQITEIRRNSTLEFYSLIHRTENALQVNPAELPFSAK